MTRSVLIHKLQKAFPKMPLRLGEDFAPDHKGTIWTGEDAGDASDGMAIFNHYGACEDPHETVWKLGSHVELWALLEGTGWHCEFYDSGTVFIYPS